MIYKLLLAIILVLPVGAWAQGPSPDVGIEEKLGKTVPMELVLSDEEGRPVRLGSLIDKPTILTLNYFRCAGICTPQLIGVMEAANLIKAEPDRDFRILTVSFDDRDTPEIALQKRSNFLQQMTRPFPPTAWRFLTGKAVDTKTLCDAVGFRFKKDGGEFLHAAVLVILSPEGKVTRYIYGVNYAPAELREALGEASRGEARPSVNKWLKFCYTSDPAGKGYVFSATRLVATLTLVAVAVFVIILIVSARRRRRRTPGERP